MNEVELEKSSNCAIDKPVVKHPQGELMSKVSLSSNQSISTAIHCLDTKQFNYSFKNNGRFTRTDDIINILKSNCPVGESVPNGNKQNISFIINNEHNKLRNQGKSSSTIDDCQPWHRHYSHKQIFGLFNYQYKLVVFHNGKYYDYCGLKRENNIQRFPEETLTLFIRNHCKGQNKQYKRKVVQVIEKSNNLPDRLLNTQIVEYVGDNPDFIQIPKNGFKGNNNDEHVLPKPDKVNRLKNDLEIQRKQKAGPSNQGYSENSQQNEIATATESSEAVPIPDDSLPRPTARKLQKKQLDERTFKEKCFDEQRFQGRRFENGRFEETRQMVAARTLQVPIQMQVQQRLQVSSQPPAPPPPSQVQVLAPPVPVAGVQSKPVETPGSTEKQIFVVAAHPHRVMSNLDSLRKSGKMCNAGIGNGSSTVMVHKVVLFAVCSKLLSVFSTDILSHKFLQVNFPEEVSTEALNAFVEYMYNGILDLDHAILEQLKIIAKKLDMKELEVLCDSHLPNYMHQQPAPAVESYTNLPLIQPSMLFPPMTSYLPSLNSTNCAPVQSVPAVTTQVLDVKELSETELAEVTEDVAAVFGQESEVSSLTPNTPGNAAGFVICPSIKTEPVGPEVDKYGYLGSNHNSQTFPLPAISTLFSSLVPAASTSITPVQASQTEFAIPFSETENVVSSHNNNQEFPHLNNVQHPQGPHQLTQFQHHTENFPFPFLKKTDVKSTKSNMKEFEELCDSHLPNYMHKPPAAATSYTSIPLIQTSMQFPSMTASLPLLSSINSVQVQSVPSITTQVNDVKQELSETELAHIKEDTAAVFYKESDVLSLALNKSGIVFSPSIKTEPLVPDDDK